MHATCRVRSANVTLETVRTAVKWFVIARNSNFKLSAVLSKSVLNSYYTVIKVSVSLGHSNGDYCE